MASAGHSSTRAGFLTTGGYMEVEKDMSVMVLDTIKKRICATKDSLL